MESSDNVDNDNKIYNQQKRKRGRPPKNSTIQKTVVNSTVNKEKIIKKKPKSEPEIILQLPITMSDVNKFKLKDTVDNKEIFVPKESSTENQDNNIFTLADMSNSSSDEYSSRDGKSDNLVKKLQDKDRQIKELKEKLSHSNISNIIGTNDKYVHNMNIKLFNSNNGEVRLEKTHHRCWWDHHKFSNYPFVIVEKYHNSTYYVTGCFCSVNCALAYNVKWFDDYRVSERHSLTIQLFRVITKSTENIELAPTWLSLDSYGGPLSIEKFRSASIKCDKDYRFSIPSISYVVPIIEENVKDSMDNKNTCSHKNSSDSDEIILKRSKPLPNSRSTLMETMGLQMERRKKHTYKEKSVAS